MSSRLLNLACGSKISNYGNWINIDFKSPKSNVRECNILNGLNFKNQFFDAVYCAQFIEHLTYTEAQKVLVDIARVLKKDGFIRLVTPDLEDLIQNYIKYLELLKVNPNKLLDEKYNWVRLEIFDQIVRDSSGGEISSFCKNCDSETQEFIMKRLGHSGKDYFNEKKINGKINFELGNLLNNFYKLPRKINEKFFNWSSKEITKIGKFRRSGEVHRYLHDFYSISKLLNNAGFINIKRQDPYTSSIPNWNRYGLDIIENKVDAPFSLYVEAQIT